MTGRVESVDPSSSRWTPAAIFFLAVAVRGGWILAAGSSLQFPDEQLHLQYARNLAEGNGFQVGPGVYAQRTFLYPLYLAAFMGLPSGLALARLGQAAMGGVAVLMGYVIGREVADRTTGLWAALFIAVDPFLIFFSSLLLTESMAVMALTMFVAGIVLMDRRVRSAIALTAASSVILAASRPAEAGIIPLGLIWLIWRRRADSTSRRASAITAAALAVVLVPWGLRNLDKTGAFSMFGLNLGYSLYDGLQPGTDGGSDGSFVESMPLLAGLGEAERNRFLIDASLKLVADDPIRILRLAGRKVIRTWSPLPHAAGYKSWFHVITSGGWFVPAMALALCGVWSWRDRFQTALLVIPAAYITLLHAIFVGSVRYRLPAMPFIEILAAIGVVWLWRRRRGTA